MLFEYFPDLIIAMLTFSWQVETKPENCMEWSIEDIFIVHPITLSNSVT